MAKVRQRTWTVPGQRTKRKAWGFVTVGEEGKQIRVFGSDWAREDAEKALSERTLKIEQPKAKGPGVTFAQAVERYLTAKARKRTIDEDRRILGHLQQYFGEGPALAEITASRISEYKGHRLTSVSGATVNRGLALLRHLLRLAHDEWELLEVVPRIRMEKEPEGRLRWLTPEEATRLLKVCRESRNADLFDLVEFGLFTGMRQGEALSLTWDRVDRARGRVLLDVTKNGRRREVPRNSRAVPLLAPRGRVSSMTGLVFGTRRWDHFRTAFETAVERAKLVDFHYHDL